MAVTDTAIFAGGCFWCVEAVFKALKGVHSIEPGYIGGHVQNPSYKLVCEGTTGHAEAIRLVFDPEVISFDVLLDVFFATHDPTQLNRQGNDVGTQYRSAIFTLSDAQEKAAREALERARSVWDAPIVTEVTSASEFYAAVDYHHDYFENNPGQPYCAAVVAPKVLKARAKFTHLLQA